LQKYIYFDYHATTPVLPEVEEAMLPYHQQFFGNPSSSHLYGQRAAMAVQKARLQVARLLSCSPETLFLQVELPKAFILL